MKPATDKKPRKRKRKASKARHARGVMTVARAGVHTRITIEATSSRPDSDGYVHNPESIVHEFQRKVLGALGSDR